MTDDTNIRNTIDSLAFGWVEAFAAIEPIHRTPPTAMGIACLACAQSVCKLDADGRARLSEQLGSPVELDTPRLIAEIFPVVFGVGYEQALERGLVAEGA